MSWYVQLMAGSGSETLTTGNIRRKSAAVHQVPCCHVPRPCRAGPWYVAAISPYLLILSFAHGLCLAVLSRLLWTIKKASVFFVISDVPCSEGLSGLRSPVHEYKSLRAARGGKSRIEHDMRRSSYSLSNRQFWQLSF